MAKLKVLPAQLANMIAAGEVVQRAASVVKELMENAIDAGASEIDVAVSDAGRSLIQVIDNGCGMSPADAVLCFERHATSKIATSEDLERILTYGFRGEALASIAAIAEVTLKTRRTGDETATQVRIAGNSDIKTSSVAAPVGSNFSVRNLFFNTPARRKFLKSDAAELRHIIAEFTRVAITRPDIAFNLSSNGRDLFILKKTSSLKQRVVELLGNNLSSELIDLEASTGIAEISGYIGRPDSAKKTGGNQFFFVNGRYFRSPYLHKAVLSAYENMIPEGYSPSYIIFLKCEPKKVDVNIHPTKSEVKFEDDGALFSILSACVRETIGKSSFGASINFEDSVELPTIGRSFEQYKGELEAPPSSFDSEFDPFTFNPNEFLNSKAGHDSGAAYSDYSKFIDKSDDYGKLFEEKIASSNKLLIIRDGKYILTPVANGIMLVNVGRARERILYDRTLKALSGGGHITQTALFPVQVKVGAEQRLLFDEHAELLSRLGFDISAFGVDTVAVNGVPEGYSCESGRIHELVSDLVYILSDGGSALPEIMNQRMAEKMASLGASHANVITSPVEAQRLIDTLFASSNAELSSNGRRIVSIIAFEEIEKLF